MKKMNLLLAVLCLFTFSTINAQTTFGIKAGANLSLVYGTSEEFNNEKIEGASPAVGFQGGVFADLGLTEKLGLMVELAYELRNSKSTVDFSGLPYPVVIQGQTVAASLAATGEVTTNYALINLPVLLRFGNGKVNTYFGPNFGYWASAKTTGKSTAVISFNGTVLQTVPADVDIDQFDNNGEADMNRFEMGLNLGANYKFSEKLFLDLRVNHGLTDITIDERDTSYTSAATRDDKDRHVSVQLSLGYKF